MKIKALITGPMVQGVGYRIFLMHQAIIEGIERFSALNVSDNAVVVLAEAEEDKISNLKEFLLNPSSRACSGLGGQDRGFQGVGDDPSGGYGLEHSGADG